MTGISRVHGSLVAPKNFAGVALQDFTVTFAAADAAAVAADYTAARLLPTVLLIKFSALLLRFSQASAALELLTVLLFASLSSR